MYVLDNMKFNHREHLRIVVEGELESTFIETCISGHTSIVGEINRISNSNVSSSINPKI